MDNCQAHDQLYSTSKDSSSTSASTSASTNLWFFDGGGTPVTHRADVEVLFSFQVTLTKELLHDAINPTPVYVQRLRRVA